jgi:diapolycopene oxygenase
VLHLGIRHDYPQLLQPQFLLLGGRRALLHTIHRRHQLPEDPHIYLVCPTKTNRGSRRRGTPSSRRCRTSLRAGSTLHRQDYEALRDRVIDKLERMGLVGLRRHVVVEDMLVPEDIERLYYSNRGAIYGTLNHWRKNYSLKAPQRSELYANLYFAGGSVNPGGAPAW